METNELPEDVKRSIDAEYGDVSDRDYGIETLSSDIADGKIKAAEFGYRLGLQTREEELGSVESLVTTLQEQLKAKDEEKERIYKHFEGVIARHLGTIDSLTKEVEQLKANNLDLAMDCQDKVQENERLREALGSIIDARNAPDMGLQSANDQLIHDAIDRCNSLLTETKPK